MEKLLNTSGATISGYASTYRSQIAKLQMRHDPTAATTLRYTLGTSVDS